MRRCTQCMRVVVRCSAAHEQRVCTWSPGEHTASSACQMDCLAPLLTTTSSARYVSPFSSCSLRTMAARSGVVPVFGV